MIQLPWPPTVNHYYTVSRGRKILSAAGRNYKTACQYLLLEQKAQKSTSGPYCVTIRAYPPDNRKRDLDNLLKPCLDALTGYGAIGDDSQIDDLRIQRFPKIPSGRIDIVISRIR